MAASSSKQYKFATAELVELTKASEDVLNGRYALAHNRWRLVGDAGHHIMKRIRERGCTIKELLTELDISEESLRLRRILCRNTPLQKLAHHNLLTFRIIGVKGGYSIGKHDPLACPPLLSAKELDDMEMPTDLPRAIVPLLAKLVDLGPHLSGLIDSYSGGGGGGGGGGEGKKEDDEVSGGGKADPNPWRQEEGEGEKNKKAHGDGPPAKEPGGALEKVRDHVKTLYAKPDEAEIGLYPVSTTVKVTAAYHTLRTFFPRAPECLVYQGTRAEYAMATVEEGLKEATYKDGWHNENFLKVKSRHITLTTHFGVAVQWQGLSGTNPRSVSASLYPLCEGENKDKGKTAATHKVVLIYRMLVLPDMGIGSDPCTGATLQVPFGIKAILLPTFILRFKNPGKVNVFDEMESEGRFHMPPETLRAALGAHMIMVNGAKDDALDTITILPV